MKGHCKGQDLDKKRKGKESNDDKRRKKSLISIVTRFIEERQ